MVLQQIEARPAGVKGIVLFNGKALTDDLLKRLKAGPFQAVAAPYSVNED